MRQQIRPRDTRCGEETWHEHPEHRASLGAVLGEIGEISPGL